MEAILDDLSKRRIIVVPFSGFFGRMAHYPNDSVEQKNYIKYVIERLSAYWNVLFNVAGPEPIMAANPFMVKEEVNRLGNIIKEYNVLDHLVTVHNQIGDDEFRGESYVSYITLQGPKTVNRKLLSEGLLKSHTGLAPVYAQETLWPGNYFHNDDYTDEDIRKNAIVIMMSAAATNFADMNGNSYSGFSGTLDFKDKFQVRHDIVKKVWDFFEGINFYSLCPMQNTVNEGYCLGSDEGEYLIYVEDKGELQIFLPEGTYSVELINAKTMSTNQQGEIIHSGKTLALQLQQDIFIHLVLS